jgi:hypothetical protein
VCVCVCEGKKAWLSLADDVYMPGRERNLFIWLDVPVPLHDGKFSFSACLRRTRYIRRASPAMNELVAGDESVGDGNFLLIIDELS